MDSAISGILPAGIGGIGSLAGTLTDRLQSGITQGATALGGTVAAGATGAIGTATGGTPVTGEVSGGSNVMQSFSDLLSQAMTDVNGTQVAADAQAAQLVTGGSVDIHQVMIGMEKANMALGLTVQVRNKLVEAYQEVMRMQI